MLLLAVIKTNIMNLFFKISIAYLAIFFVACSDDDVRTVIETETITETVTETVTETITEFVNPFDVQYERVSALSFNDGVAEISAYDSITQQVFSTNPDDSSVEITDISDIENPVNTGSIDITPFGGNLNSVSVLNGMLAIAIEGADSSTDQGGVVVFNTSDLTTPIINLEVGFLPDMVTFSPDGKYILSANEGEPNDENTVDPAGTISIINIADNTINTIGFESFNNQEASLKEGGFRVFRETNSSANALNIDVEPEFIAISDDSSTAYVTLQENNGIAVVDIASQQITEILPLGTKDFNVPTNKIDVSDRDNTIQFNNWNVIGFYQPDAIDFFSIAGVDYLITANEGDARAFDGFSEEVRVEDLILDPTVYPDAATLQLEENLGRLEVTTANGDIDDDGDIDQIHTFGGRSFSIWNTNGDLVYDSGNTLDLKSVSLGTYPDGRSDAKGTEPESVVTQTVGDFVYAFVGLERSGDVFVYNITNPASPIFLQSLANSSPEGLLVVPASESPNDKDLLIVSNEGGDDEGIVIFSK